MSEKLQQLRGLPRWRILEEVRRIAEMPSLRFWEQVSYNDIWEAVRAGPLVASQLGVQVGDVIGYRVIQGTPTGGALGDLAGVVPQNDAPFRDPFSIC